MRLAIFDFDGTIYPGETLPRLCIRYREFASSRTRYYRTMSLLIGMYLLYKGRVVRGEPFREKAIVRFISLFRGASEQHIRDFFGAAYEKLSQSVQPSGVERDRPS